MLENREVEDFAELRQLDKFMIGHKGFIAGGCFKDLFNNHKIKDVDMFFEKASDFEEAVFYFEGQCGVENNEFVPAYKTDNVTAYRHLKSNIVLELVCKLYGTAEEIIGDFDFTIVKFAYFKTLNELDDSINYKVLCHRRFFEHLFQKRLVIDDKIPLPHNTFNRVVKYARYGYFPCRETKIKLLEAIQKTTQEINIDKSLYDGKD